MSSFILSKSNYGFSLIQLMITLLIFSALGLSVSSYMKKSQSSLNVSDSSSDILNSALLVQKLLADDIKQVAFVRPGCGGAPSTSTTACSSVKVRGGVTVLPGYSKSDIHAATNSVGIPDNLTSATSSLAKNDDGLRIVQFNFASTFNCKLNSYASPNPSTTAGSGAGAERFNALRSGCNGNLAVNGLYLMLESINSVVYSNVFQITALSDLGGNATSASQLQVDAVSSGNIFNQSGGLGLSGFSSNARIYPIKLVEWGHEPGEGLYRREIIPTASSINGYGSWNLLGTDVEGLQFYPVTVTTTSVVEHQRTMQLTNDTNNDGIEDVRGVSPRFVIKSSKATSDGSVYDNPLTTAVENDHFPRKEVKFYVDIKNTHTN